MGYALLGLTTGFGLALTFYLISLVICWVKKVKCFRGFMFIILSSIVSSVGLYYLTFEQYLIVVAGILCYGMFKLWTTIKLGNHLNNTR